MAIFSYCYEKVLHWSRKKQAQYYLAGVSFAESSFFPVPPDVMLVPMVLGTPHKAWNLALITTLFSILGGVFGYCIGAFAFDTFGSAVIYHLGYEDYYHKVVEWFKHYGVWVVFIAGVTPIPYKIFTITAGAVHMALLPFVIASLIGRGLRFFVVALVSKILGIKYEDKLRKYIDLLGWLSLSLIGLGVIVFSLAGCSTDPLSEGAPVVEIYHEGNLPDYHQVKKGDSLFSLSWKYGIDFKEIAKANGIKSPYTIYPGQKLALQSSAEMETVRTVDVNASDSKPTEEAADEVKPKVVTPSKYKEKPKPKKATKGSPTKNLVTIPNQNDGFNWRWPTQGELAKTFSNNKNSKHKGIDIINDKGTHILAAEAGKVVYSGVGLRGYGQLVIIKHDDSYLSAYAHNDRIFVAEGDKVSRGQKIAEMGNTDSDRVKLHFEIRKNGQPIDPLLVLPNRA